MIRFKKDGGSWGCVHSPSGTFLNLDNGLRYLIIERSSNTVYLETDLKVLYKKDKKGRWREMVFSLTLDSVIASPCLTKVISAPGMKDRRYSSPIKKVSSKIYSDVIQERLIAAHKKKRDRDGWVEDKGDVALQEPMLLHHYDEFKDNIVFPALIMPKLNGIRATYKFNTGLISRKRNFFKKLDVLTHELTKFSMSLDGELWVPRTSLEDIVSMVKGGSKDIEYHVFDRPQGGSYNIRMARVMKELKAGNYPHIKVVPISVVESYMEMKVAAKTIMTLDGCDGAVVRNMNVDYGWDTRSKEVLKIKDTISKEYTVVGVTYDEDILGPLVKLIFDTEGTRFDYSPAWTKERRAEVYRNHMDGTYKLNGTSFTLTFREYTKNGLPKHIMDLQERSYE